MTKTIIIGKSITRTSIVFTKMLEETGKWSTVLPGCEPNEFDYIELISKDYSRDFDLMFAYDSDGDRGKGILMQGFWNDGVVE